MNSSSNIIRSGEEIENDVTKIFSIYPAEDLIKSKLRKKAEKPQNKSTIEKQDPETILRQAVQNAENIEADAIKKAKTIVKEAKDEGLSRGYEEGSNKAHQEISDIKKQTLTSLESIIGNAVKQKDKILVSSEPLIISLALAVAKKIIDSELSANPEIVKNMVKKALEKVVDSHKLKLRISPVDYEIIKDELSNISLKAGISSTIDIVQDKHIETGGCIIETDAGNIDAQVSTQLEELGKSLRKHHGQL